MSISETLLTTALGDILVRHPEGTFPPSEASRTALVAIGSNQELLCGRGIDWGSGSGCLTIAAARVVGVRDVTGLEVSKPAVSAARENAEINGVSVKTRFIQADSFSPLSRDDINHMDELAGRADFLITNPPASEGDGFDFYRKVLREAGEFLVPGAPVLITTSIQYGMRRVDGLTSDAAGFEYRGVLASTDWVPFDIARADLMHCLELYAFEEQNGGWDYEFGGIENDRMGATNARTALAEYHRSGNRPLTKWLTYLFVRQP